MIENNKRAFRIIAVIYFALLLYLTLFSDNRYQHYDYRSGANFIPLNKFISFFRLKYRSIRIMAFLEIVGNFILFIPLPSAIFVSINRKTTGLTALIISIIIECIQYSLNIGFFDVDDMILNTLGGIAGVAVLNKLVKI